MFYSDQLSFLQSIFEKCHLHTTVIDPLAPFDAHNAFGVNYIFEDWEKFAREVYVHITPMSPRTIYKLTDPFSCSYLFLQLPESQLIFVIGPYLSEELPREFILELAEKLRMDPRQSRHLEEFYSTIPVLTENRFVLAAIDSFAEYIWNGEDFNAVDINRDIYSPMDLFTVKESSFDSENTIINMRVMEERYALENQIMEAVSLGQTRKIELILSNLTNNALEPRLPDQLRNIKNYCIVMNTLLRKAAESGGVHPVHLDSISSNFAIDIERTPTIHDAEKLMKRMFVDYCELVRIYSVKTYSPAVQNTILYIDGNLMSDLSLSTLAQIQNLSSGYLSTLFKRETGQTLTEYVNRKRVEQAARLLETTKLQIQTVAQHCGVYDVHYFSRIFKKHYGKTPKEYRESR